MAPKRICVIGAGPSGMSILYHIEKMKKQGREVPEIVCFEKQSNWGGLWNYSWRTGMKSNFQGVLQFFFLLYLSTHHSTFTLISKIIHLKLIQ